MLLQPKTTKIWQLYHTCFLEAYFFFKKIFQIRIKLGSKANDLLIFRNQNLMSNNAGGAEKCLSGEFNQIMTFN